MRDFPHHPAAARVTILSEAYSRVTLVQAATLVGILFEYRFVLSLHTWNAQTQTSAQRSVVLQPLDPQIATKVVADLFDLDCDQVLLQFQQEWGTLKHSIVFQECLAELRSQASVDQLERVSGLA